MDTVTVDDLASLMQALAAAEGGARIEIAAGDYGAPDFANLDFDDAVIVTSAEPGDPAVFRGATRIVDSRNLVLQDVTLEAGRALRSPVLVIGRSRDITVEGISVRGHIPGSEGADPLAPETGRRAQIAGFPFGDGVQIRDSTDIVLSEAEITEVRRALAVFQAEDVRMERLEVHGVREGLNLHDVTGITLADSHFHDFVSWLPMGSDGYESRRHDHVDMVQYWGVRSRTGLHDITISGNLFEQTPGTRVQAIFGHLGGAPETVTATDFTVTGNVILNGHKHGIRLGGVQGGEITGNVLLPNGTDVAPTWVPRIELTGASRDLTVSGNVMVRPRGGNALINQPLVRLDALGVDVTDNVLLSQYPGDPMYWETWKTRHLDPVLPGMRR